METVLPVAGLKADTTPGPLCLPYSEATLRAKSQVVLELAKIPPPQFPPRDEELLFGAGAVPPLDPVVVPPPWRCSLIWPSSCLSFSSWRPWRSASWRICCSRSELLLLEQPATTTSRTRRGEQRLRRAMAPA